MTSLNCSQNAAKHYTFSAWTAPPIVLHPPALHPFRCCHPSTVGNLDFTDLAYFFATTWTFLSLIFGGNPPREITTEVAATCTMEVFFGLLLCPLSTSAATIMEIQTSNLCFKSLGKSWKFIYLDQRLSSMVTN